MIFETLVSLGPWTWFIVGFALLIGEAVLPGVFLVWFGAAALVIGALTLAPFTDVSWWPWQAQLIAFGVLSLVAVLVGRKLFPADRTDDEASRMNDPLGRHVGKEAVLVEELVNGVGRIRLGDTTWRVRGPDTPVGTKIKVVAVQDGSLLVIPA